MGAINKFMNMLNIGSNDENNVDDYDDDQEVQDTTSTYKSRRNFNEIEQESPYSARNIQSKVIPMNTAISSSKMVITQPNCYEDVQEIGDYLKSKKSVIVNLESVNKEDARRILDFMSGATFAVEGTIQKVSNLIYLITPRNVEIQNDVERSQYKQKLSFSWMK
ncbi:MAG: cell division protein SepF [Clostridia bacterium]|nr:cell division protein SepF [Clostridia bacterium]MDD4386196.1 cell division protein SepF [Clostridia bacterium]